MADLRISELPALVGANLAAGDLLPIVDTSASETKKVTISDAVGYGVTLIADATIPGSKILFTSGSIPGNIIVDGSLGTNEIANDAVTAAKLANESTVDLVTTLPASGAYIGQLALDIDDNKVYCWDGSTWVSFKAAGSVNAVIGGSTGIVNVTVSQSGDTVTINTALDNTSGAAQFLAGPTSGAGVVGYRQIASGDLPTAAAGGKGAVIVNGQGLAMSGDQLVIDNTISASGSTFGVVQYNAKGLVTNGRAITAADLPAATGTDIGAVKPGTGLTMAMAGAISHSNSVTPASGVKLSFDAQGHVTGVGALLASDIPELPASKLTSGTLSMGLIGTKAITGDKFADSSTVQFGGASSTEGVVTFPTAQFRGQMFFDALNGDLYLYDGAAWQPITITAGELILAGFYNANTNRVKAVTAAGNAAGLVVGAALPPASNANLRYYLVVTDSGTGTAPAPAVALAPPDMIVSSGIAWELVDVSSGIAGQLASNISFTPYGDLASTNVQSALQELDDDKLAKAGGTITGNLEIGAAGSLTWEGSTADAYETTLTVVDPTADRTITLPDRSGTVITTGDTGTVTSAMIASGVAGSKITPDFGAQNILTTGTVTGANFSPTSTTLPAAGLYLPGANVLGFTVNSAEALRITAAGSLALGSTDTNVNVGFRHAKAITGATTAFAQYIDSTIQTDVTTTAVGVATQIGAAASATIAGLVHFQAATGTLGAGSSITNQYGFVASSSMAGATNDYGFFGNIGAGTGNWNCFMTGAAPNYFAGQVQLGAGSAGTPSLSTNGDTDTGIHFPAANSLGFATGGTERMRLTSTGLGIGVSAPLSTIHVQNGGTGVASGGDAASDATIEGANRAFGNGYVANLAVLSNSTRAADAGGAIVLGGKYDGNQYAYFGGIKSGKDNSTAGEYGGYLAFATRANGANLLEKMRLDSSGRLGIGTTAPAASLHLEGADFLIKNGTGVPYLILAGRSSDGRSELAFRDSTYASNNARFVGLTNQLALEVGGSEALRVDSSRRLLVGTSSARTLFTGYVPALQVETTGTPSPSASFIHNSNDVVGATLFLGKSRGSSNGSNTVIASGDELGTIAFNGADGTDIQTIGATIKGVVDGTPGANDLPTRLVLSTTADGASSPTERMRVRNDGDILLAKTDVADTVAGFRFHGNVTSLGAADFTRDGGRILRINRLTSDGDLIEFAQANVTEGTISVSGTTVSYNGAHLSRWSQLPSGAERTEILRGTVLSNIDEMCEWGEEDNEQLNRMKVSDVEGDKNVAGVFQAWDDDDDTYANDFYCAMTGDFIIRIAQGVSVQRGDLLMSAGDGTAKPQEDDIIRSKTIAKVTSTNVSCTYPDGSYCVPCVLMAC